MKIRTPDCQCIICHDNGEPIIKAVDQRGTYHAIKRMRTFVDHLIAEREALTAGQSPPLATPNHTRTSPP